MYRYNCSSIDIFYSKKVSYRSQSRLLKSLVALVIFQSFLSSQVPKYQKSPLSTYSRTPQNLYNAPLSVCLPLVVHPLYPIFPIPPPFSSFFLCRALHRLTLTRSINEYFVIEVQRHRFHARDWFHARASAHEIRCNEQSHSNLEFLRDQEVHVRRA